MLTLTAAGRAPKVFAGSRRSRRASARSRRSASRWSRCAQRRGARRRLGDRARRALPHLRSTIAKIQLGLPEVTLGLLPGAGGVTKMMRLLGLQAAQPYLVEGKRCGPQRGAEAGPACRASRREPRGPAHAWRASGSPPTRRRSSPGTRRTTACRAARPSSPKIVADAGGRAGDADEEDARPVPGARGDPAGDGRGRAASTSTPRLRIEIALPRQARGRPGREEHDHSVLLQPAPRSSRAPRGPRTSPKWKADEGRHPRRRHDGRRHRLRERRARHRLRAEGRQHREGARRAGAYSEKVGSPEAQAAARRAGR